MGNGHLRVNEFVDTIISGNDLTFNLEFQRDEESGWFVVHVVELPGCVSQGANALEAYMEVLLETAILDQAAREGSVSVESSVSETAKMLVRLKFEVRA